MRRPTFALSESARYKRISPGRYWIRLPYVRWAFSLQSFAKVAWRKIGRACWFLRIPLTRRSGDEVSRPALAFISLKVNYRNAVSKNSTQYIVELIPMSLKIRIRAPGVERRLTELNAWSIPFPLNPE